MYGFLSEAARLDPEGSVAACRAGRYIPPQDHPNMKSIRFRVLPWITSTHTTHSCENACYIPVYLCCLCHMSYIFCLRYITLRYITLRYITLRYVTLCCAMLCYVMLRYVMLCYLKHADKHHAFHLFSLIQVSYVMFYVMCFLLYVTCYMPYDTC